MKYMGSKRLLKKDIIPILENIIKENNIKTYIEPFVGGANVIDSVNCQTKIGSDVNKYLIELFKHSEDVKKMPDIITKEDYSKVRDSYHNNDSQYSDWYKGAVGFLSSYNGRFFDGGYSGIRQTEKGIRNYYLATKNGFLKQFKNLKNVEWKVGDYAELYSDVEGALIYCDIPYKNTKKYGVCKKFDYDRFWNWVREMSVKNIVIVSELEAPDDFNIIWQKEIKVTIDYKSSKKVIEKMFKFKG